MSTYGGSAAGGGRRGSPPGRPFAGGGYRTKRVVGPPPRRREALRGAPSFDAARSHALQAATCPCRPASCRHASRRKRRSRQAAMCGCTKSNTNGFRIIARKDGNRVRLYSRPGNDLTYRFPLIVESLARLRSRSCIINGEAVACDDNGMPSFDRIRYRRHDSTVFLFGFDLIELNGDDLRREPLEVRKATHAPFSRRLRPVCASTSISKPMAAPCSPMPARWASKGSCQSAGTRPTAPAARRTGSNQRTRLAQR
jgi:hypothetical protein